jgi:hypothetical protein
VGHRRRPHGLSCERVVTLSGSAGGEMRKKTLASIEPWVANFNGLVRGRKSMCQATLKDLEQTGCDVSLIFELLFGSTCPEQGEIVLKSILRQRRNHLCELNRAIERLKTALGNEEIKQMIQQFSSLSVELPDALAVAGGDLTRHLDTYDLRKYPRQLALFALCLYVRRVTGSYHYAKIANLLQVAYQAHNTPRIVDEHSLAREVRRFNRTHPELSQGLVDFFSGR